VSSVRKGRQLLRVYRSRLQEAECTGTANGRTQMESTSIVGTPIQEARPFEMHQMLKRIRTVRSVDIVRIRYVGTGKNHDCLKLRGYAFIRIVPGAKAANRATRYVLDAGI